ncbi:carboxypeptidase regulatory-like domain-containing protein [Blastopirellula sp. J2-11]|uniref:carboxypeptidase regulatory-like domain-containing protein n=1 Tax=Blastopirellula sp. J2-11 TaxID=2943192 RepID=UPI0021C9EE01|nr:carboxypeptidase regulatory-like domain-containing protein [Blastopirellula sp. J2-11]UUO05910.1 carboxypeptidase regulatory-like domain-containing protein [Blastopirellula sp. J2-11]
MQNAIDILLRKIPCLLALLVLGVGCFGGNSSHPGLVEVSGVLTIDGKPAKDISVVFQPEAGGNASRGTTLEDGSYQLMFDRHSSGALPGTHRIRFLSMAIDSTGASLPAKYRRPETGITVEVTREGPNEFPFELSGK